VAADWSTYAAGTPGGTGSAYPSSTTLDYAIFNGTSYNATNEVALIAGTTTVAGLTFNSTGTTSIQNSGTATEGIELGGITMNAGAGTVTFSNAGTYAVIVDLTASETWTNNSSNFLVTDYQVNQITGPYSLTLAGTGVTNMLGTASYTGGTTISLGSTLQIGDGIAGSDGVLSNTGSLTDAGTLIYDNTSTETYSATITGTGALIKSGTGTIILTGTNSLSGGITVSGGTLQALDPNDNNTPTGTFSPTANPLGAGNTIYLNSGTLQLRSYGGTIGSPRQTSLEAFGNNVIVGGAGTVDIARTAGGPGDNIGGFQLGALSIGAGESLAVTTPSGSQVNYYGLGFSGTTTLTSTTGGSATVYADEQGTATDPGVVLANVTGDATTGNTDTLVIGGNFTQSSQGYTYGAKIGGTISDGSGGGKLALTVNSTETGFVLNIAASNTYTGGTTISAGTLQLGSLNSTPLGYGSVILAGGTLDLYNRSATLYGLSGNTGTILDTHSYTAGNGVSPLIDDQAISTSFGGLIRNGTYSTPIPIEVNMNGTGMLTLTGSNTYAGGTVVSEGTLADGSGGVPGAFGTGSVSVTPTGTTLAASAELVANSNTTIASTAALIVNDNSGAYGTVFFNSAAPVIGSLTGNGNVVLNGTSGTGLNIGSAGSTTFAGVISDPEANMTGLTSGSLTINGATTFTLAGTSTYFGSTNISSGTLDISGALSNSGTVNITGSANLILAGASALSSNATLNTGSLATASVNAAQTIASLASAGNATFTAGTSVVGLGNGVGTGTGTSGFTTGGIVGTGTLTVSGSANLYASTITQTLLTIGSTNSVTIADSSAPGNTAATSVLTDISDSGTLDLNNNDLIVLDTTQYSTVKALIVNAYDGGAWDQPGITSSSARANAGAYGLGYAQASTIGSTSFDGKTFTDAVLVKYTLLGDTQLRGTVGIGDYDTVLSNYGTPQDWSGGNFHYSGVVGIGDYDDVLSNYGAHASGNLTVGPALTAAVTRGISPAASIGPDLAKTDLKLEVNTTTGDVYVLATASTAFTGYTISDPTAHLLGGSTSPDPDKLLSVAAGSGGNTNVYETSGTYADWFKITETASQVAEGQQQNGFGTHSSRDDTINIPAGGTIDFGEIYNTAAAQQDLTFDFAEAGTEPTNGPTYYGAEVDYIASSTPEPATLGLLGLAGAMLARRRRKPRVFENTQQPLSA
jgi:autotransporter-associated beta strand protein